MYIKEKKTNEPRLRRNVLFNLKDHLFGVRTMRCFCWIAMFFNYSLIKHLKCQFTFLKLGFSCTSILNKQINFTSTLTFQSFITKKKTYAGQGKFPWVGGDEVLHWGKRVIYDKSKTNIILIVKSWKPFL